jgi:dTDP-4-dehydrorhamnose reductase
VTVRVLVTGGAGQLGREVAAAFGGHDVTAVDSGRLDVCDREMVDDALAAVAPDLVVHCAAWTDVDGCETDVERAFTVNALGTRHVASAARSAGAHLVYVSTDYVFDGTLGRSYHEWDATNPLSVYGASKLAGEREAGPEATVVRTAWLFSGSGRNIVATILDLLGRDAPLRFVDDQRGSPTHAADLADTIRRIGLERLLGTFHVVNQGAASWYEVACEVVRCAGGDPDRVEPITTAQLDPPRPARRPPFSALDSIALRAEGLPSLPEWQDAVARAVASLSA